MFWIDPTMAREWNATKVASFPTRSSPAIRLRRASARSGVCATARHRCREDCETRLGSRTGPQRSGKARGDRATSPRRTRTRRRVRRQRRHSLTHPRLMQSFDRDVLCHVTCSALPGCNLRLCETKSRRGDSQECKTRYRETEQQTREIQ